MMPEEQLKIAPTGRPHTQWREFWRGYVAIAPLFLGAIPFGMIYGVLAVNVGLTKTLAQGMSLIIFAGSAQFITVQLLQEHAPLTVIIVTGLVLNLRHLLYSASIAPYLQSVNRSWKTILAYLLTDEAYAVAITRYWQDDLASNEGGPSVAPSYAHWYFLGIGAGLWLTWQLSTALGIFLGAQIPSSWSLDFAVPLTFIALVVPALRNRPMLVAASVAGVTALLAVSLPLKLGLVTAMVAGIGAGWLTQSWQKPTASA